MPFDANDPLGRNDVGSWTPDVLWNFIRERLSQLPDNTRALINQAVSNIQFPNTPPPGHIGYTARTTAPDGWLVADGTAVSRTTYADLFDAIGTTYGTGDGSTTFNLPDARGREMVGLGTHADVAAVGQREATLAFPSGLPVGSRTPAHLHQHTHSHGMEHNHDAGSLATGGTVAHQNAASSTHTHSESGGGTTGGPSANVTLADSPHTHSISGSTGNTSNGGVTGDLTGSGQDNTATNYEPYIVFLAVIKT